MSLATQIEALTAPNATIDHHVAVLFGCARPTPSGHSGSSMPAYGSSFTRRISTGPVRNDNYTASYDAVESLIIGGHFLGSVRFTADADGKPLVLANFRGKEGRGFNLACAMLAAIIRFYVPEQG